MDDEPTLKIELAEQTEVKDAFVGVMHITEALGHPGALVTDLSEVRDFGCFTDESEVPLLDALEKLLGRRPKCTERIYELAREYEDKL